MKWCTIFIVIIIIESFLQDRRWDYIFISLSSYKCGRNTRYVMYDDKIGQIISTRHLSQNNDI